MLNIFRGKSKRIPPRHEVNAKLVGLSPSIDKPQFPRADKTVLKGKMPEQLNVQSCRHCGSGQHWDNDCKHAKKGTTMHEPI